MALAQHIKAQARALGFELVGIAPATPADGFEQLRNWLAQGYAGEMHYLERQAASRQHPSSILPDVKSVVMVGMNYKPDVHGPQLVARYAQGTDYHTVLRGKLNQLLDWVQREAPGCRGRGVVDTAPLLERDFARRAGLGWFGKNTMLLHKQLGSYFFLGALLLDIELPADAPYAASHCGSCTACLQACPTQAFTGPYQLDSRRCISYLTIELRGPVPVELRPRMGEWLFGCDVCQEVCPWNRKSPLGNESALQPRAEIAAIDPAELLALSDDEFRRRFRDTALWRTKRRGLLRNAAIGLGNRGDPAALPALQQALTDPEELVREAAAWAIEQITSQAAVPAG